MDIVSDGAIFSPSFVAGDILPGDAEYIVHAVNCHEDLLAVCREIEAIDTRLAFGLRAQLRAAIAKTEGKQP